MNSELESAFTSAAEMHDLFLALGQKEERLPGTLRSWFFLLLYDLATEHHGALLMLVRTGHHMGSAFALLRPILEVSLRAIWVDRCASDEQIKRIAEEEKQFPGLAQVRREVEESLAKLGVKGFFDMERVYIDQLHGLVHGGVEALKHRIGGNGLVQASYPEAAVRQLLKQATYFTTLVAIARAQIVSGDWETSAPDTSVISDRYAALFPKG